MSPFGRKNRRGGQLQCNNSNNSFRPFWRVPQTKKFNKLFNKIKYLIIIFNNNKIIKTKILKKLHNPWYRSILSTDV